MNIAFYTHDLEQHNQHLMPWRTVLEVARSINRAPEHKAIVLSGSRAEQQGRMDFVGVHAWRMPKPRDRNGVDAISQVLDQHSIDVAYYPVSPKLSTNRGIIKAAQKTKTRVVWYMPGAWYNPGSTLKAIPCMGLKSLLPYIYQSLIPPRYFVKSLLKHGHRRLITASAYNCAMFEKYGYPAEMVVDIPPGKAPLAVDAAQSLDRSERVRSALAGRPFFLFFGPPQAIRGIWQVLNAFKALAKENDQVCLVCLFRADENLKTDVIQHKIGALNLQADRFFCEWESVNTNELHHFIQHSYAVLKPFLLVPSEIPLAIIEAAGYGKPVIGTGPSGTGKFVEQFGVMVPPADARALARAMRRLLDDRDFYNALCRKATELYQKHPGWDEVAEQWLQVGADAMHGN